MPSAYPGPDLEIDGDLMSQDDESDTLAVDFEIDALPKKQRPLWQWIVTALVPINFDIEPIMVGRTEAQTIE